MGAAPKHSINRKAWWCYLLLGAGILAPWNAFITATDFFSAVFPDAHVDRLFTVSYLPACLLLLILCVVGGEKQRWLGTSHTRISVCYVSFTLVMLLVPLVNTLGSLWYSGTTPPSGSLTCLMMTVVIVGALDGACQGAVFSDAAQHGPAYTQAVASGTACSGLLVSLLRCACKAAWMASDAPPMSSLRASTAMYFVLGAVLTAACWVVHAVVLPRLVVRPGVVGQGLVGSGASGRGAGTSVGCLEMADGADVGGSDRDGEGEVSVGSVDARRRLQRRVTNMESAPLLGGAGSSGGDGGAILGGSPRGAWQVDGGVSAGGGGGVSPPVPSGGYGAAGSECSFVREGQEDDDVDDVVVLVTPCLPPPSPTAQPPPPPFDTQETLLSGSQGATPRGAWPQEAAQQLVHLHHRQQHTDGASGWGAQGGGQRKAQMRAAFSVLRPYCISLFLTYCVTLSIFPGFLAEDVHSAELGEWYALIIITCFNAADFTGKLIGPNHEGISLPPTDPSVRVGHGRQAHVMCSPTLLIRRPTLLVALATVRGLVLLAVFLGFSVMAPPSWLVITSTLMLGLSNGWLTVICMCACGPGLLSEDLVEVGEGLLVVALISGLTAGALCGWLWLIPGGG